MVDRSTLSGDGSQRSSPRFAAGCGSPIGGRLYQQNSVRYACAVTEGGAVGGGRALRGVSLLVALLLVGGAAAALAPGAGAYVYWARGAGGGVGRANNDGSDVRNKFIPGSGEGSDCGVAVDSSHVYWVNS